MRGIASRSRTLARRFGLLALVLGITSAIVAGAAAYVPIGSDVRVSTVGTDGDEERDAATSSLAYNTAANEYLVVWDGDGGGLNNDFEIWGQRLTASGSELGGDFQITTTASANDPAVAYNPAADEYLVTWRGDADTVGTEFETFGQRLDADGTPIGGELPISQVNPAGSARAAFDPRVAYNSTANEWLVTWIADGLATDNDFEVFGRRLEADGDQIGTDDFRISTTNPDGPANVVGDPEIAYSPAANEFLVAWSGNPAPEAEFEIWGQRLSGAGAELGGDFQISAVDTPDDTRDAVAPSLAHNQTANEYLVAWSADGPPAVDDEFEVFAQRLSIGGGELGGDFRVSTVGPLGVGRDGLDPSVAYSSTGNEYLVTWSGDDLVDAGEFEIFGQRLSGAGSGLGGEFRISSVGTDGDTDRRGDNPAVAFGGAANEFLTTWSGDDFPADEEEFEIFGRRLAPAPPALPSALTPPGGAPPTVAARKKCKKGFRLKKVKGKRKCVRKKRQRS